MREKIKKVIESKTLDDSTKQNTLQVIDGIQDAFIAFFDVESIRTNYNFVSFKLRKNGSHIDVKVGTSVEYTGLIDGLSFSRKSSVKVSEGVKLINDWLKFM